MPNINRKTKDKNDEIQPKKKRKVGSCWHDYPAIPQDAEDEVSNRYNLNLLEKKSALLKYECSDNAIWSVTRMFIFNQGWVLKWMLPKHHKVLAWHLHCAYVTSVLCYSSLHGHSMSTSNCQNSVVIALKGVHLHFYIQPRVGAAMSDTEAL